jgi:predicted transcriptional regulator
VIRKLEAGALPLQVMEGIRETRAYLERLEREALLEARRLGASPTDIAEALGVTRQGVYHKLKRIGRTRVVELEPSEPLVVPELEHEHD